MANRFVLNETSYHGAGAIQEIAGEVKVRGFNKCFVCADPDLIKFGVTKKVTDVLMLHLSHMKSTAKSSQTQLFKMLKQVWLHSRLQVQIALLQSVEVLQWTLQRLSALSL